MKIQCDVCEKEEARVFCGADEAALCEGCDYRVHDANKLSTKHLRFSLLHPSFKDAPLCDICQEKRAFLFCKEDRAIVCRECDISVHKSNTHTQNHNRFLLTGVRISSQHQNNNSTNSNSISNNHSQSYSTTSNNKQSNITSSSTSYDQINEDYGSVSVSVSVSGNNDDDGDMMQEYLLRESMPGWRLQDLVDSSSSYDHQYKTFDYTNYGNQNQQVEEENYSGMWESQHQHQHSTTTCAFTSSYYTL